MNLEMNVMVNWALREVRHRSGCRCKLSARETALLACLARKAGTPVSRDEILSQVWQLDPTLTATRTIDMHISFLRRKLDDPDRPSVLITVHGVGYMLHRDAISCDDVPPASGAVGRVPWELLTGLESLSVA
jgi:DNA-binding response OmpR family regulator